MKNMSYFLAFCLALCWGTAFLASKNMVEALPPWWSTFFRVLAGLLFFVVFYGVQRKNVRCPVRELWRPWTIGLLLILLPFAALSWGIQHTAPTVAGIFNGTVPIWSFMAGAILLKGVDRFTWRRAYGVIIGLIGLLVIMWPKVQTALNTPSSQLALLGYAALWGMALCYSLGNVFTKKIMVDSNAVSLEANTFNQYLFSAVVLLAVAFVLEPFPAASAFTGKVIISIFCAGVFSSAVAFLLMVELIKRWGATRMASVTYFTPIVALATDMIFRARMPHTPELIGMGLIFISLWLIQKPVQVK